MPLQKSARGLSDFLGRFQGGTVPLEFEGIVQPSFDVRNFLIEPEVHNSTSLGQTNYFATEPGFIYEGIWMGGELTVAAGEQYLGVGPSLLVGANPEGLTDSENITIAGSYLRGLRLDGLVWGQHLELNAIGWAAGAILGTPQSELYVIYRKYRI